MNDYDEIKKVEQGKDLRIYLNADESIIIKLNKGKAEIEGRELLENSESDGIMFTNKNIIIYCWEESLIHVKGKLREGNNPFTSSTNIETMKEYVVANYYINELRNNSLINNKLGPKILVTGSKSCGKRTFCHTILNYSLKLGWSPIFCDLDLNNEISIPGSIASTVIDHLVPNDFMIDNSIILFHGSKKENINYYLYDIQIAEMGDTCINKMKYDLNFWKKKLNLIKDNFNSFNNDYLENKNNLKNFVHCEHPTIFSSGLIVLFPFLECNTENDIFNTIIKHFDIDIIYVIDNEKLCNDLNNIQFDKKLDIILLSKLNGIEQSSSFKENSEQNKFNLYFDGPFNTFNKNKITIDLNFYKLLQINSTGVTDTMLPIGERSHFKLSLEILDINDENFLNRILYRIVAIVFIDNKTINELDNNFKEENKNNYVSFFSKATVSYFGVITEHKNNTITIYGPCKDLPHKYLILGDIKMPKI